MRFSSKCCISRVQWSIRKIHDEYETYVAFNEFATRINIHLQKILIKKSHNMRFFLSYESWGFQFPLAKRNF